MDVKAVNLGPSINALCFRAELNCYNFPMYDVITHDVTYY